MDWQTWVRNAYTALKTRDLHEINELLWTWGWNRLNCPDDKADECWGMSQLLRRARIALGEVMPSDMAMYAQMKLQNAVKFSN